MEILYKLFKLIMNKTTGRIYYLHQFHIYLLHNKWLVYKRLVQFNHLSDICRKWKKSQIRQSFKELNKQNISESFLLLPLEFNEKIM